MALREGAAASWEVSASLVDKKGTEFLDATSDLLSATAECAAAAKAGTVVRMLCAEERRTYSVLGDAGPEAAALMTQLSGLERQLEVLVSQARLADTQAEHITCLCCGWQQKMGRYADKLRQSYAEAEDARSRGALLGHGGAAGRRHGLRPRRLPAPASPGAWVFLRDGKAPLSGSC